MSSVARLSSCNRRHILTFYSPADVGQTCPMFSFDSGAHWLRITNVNETMSKQSFRIPSLSLLPTRSKARFLVVSVAFGRTWHLAGIGTSLFVCSFTPPG